MDSLTSAVYKANSTVIVSVPEHVGSSHRTSAGKEIVGISNPSPGTGGGLRAFDRRPAAVVIRALPAAGAGAAESKQAAACDASAGAGWVVLAVALLWLLRAMVLGGLLLGRGSRPSRFLSTSSVNSRVPSPNGDLGVPAAPSILALSDKRQTPPRGRFGPIRSLATDEIRNGNADFQADRVDGDDPAQRDLPALLEQVVGGRSISIKQGSEHGQTSQEA